MPQLKEAPSHGTSRYLLFSVDTEPDDPTWSGLSGGPWSHENLGGLAELGDRMRALGVRPTYLVSHSVAVSGRLEALLAKDLAALACEVGTHFHPGDTPPFPKLFPQPSPRPFPQRADDSAAAATDNIVRVPTALLEEKFANLHAAISARFGAPTSYRSGAWAMDGRITALLKRYGYRVDSSVTPGVSWRGNGRPSYLAAPMRAYPLGSGDPSLPDPAWPGPAGEGGILEVPVSIWSPRRWDGTFAGRLAGDLLTMPLAARNSLPVRIIRALRPQAPQWLRPAFMKTAEMEAVSLRLEEAGADYLHVMCHSNELWPGASPYCRDRRDLEEVHARLEGIFRFALGRGYMPVTLSDYAARSRAAGKPFAPS